VALSAAILLTVWHGRLRQRIQLHGRRERISAAHALLGGAAYACLGLWRADEFLLAGGATVAAGALAFLPWNAVRARVFLGDAAATPSAPRWGAGRGRRARRHSPEAAFGPLPCTWPTRHGRCAVRMLAGGAADPAASHASYQRLCDAGLVAPAGDAGTGSVTAALSLLGAARPTPYPSLRAAADLAAAALLALYCDPRAARQPHARRRHAGPAQRGGLRCARSSSATTSRRRPARRRNGCRALALAGLPPGTR